jgi:hypothetical protein
MPNSNNNNHPVTLPSAALQAEDYLPDEFTFSTTTPPDPDANPAPPVNIPDQAEPHTPTEIPPQPQPETAVQHLIETPPWEQLNDPFSLAITSRPSLAANTQPLANVPDEALDRIPDDVPPALPDTAVQHINETPAWDHLGQFLFAPTGGPTLASDAQPLANVPDEALDHIPDDVPPALPDTAVEHMNDTALGLIAEHAGWLLEA